MAKKPDYPHQEMLELYESLINELPDQQKKGKANPYTSMNGNMFSFLDKKGKLSLRLSKEDQQELIEKYDAQPSIQYGSTMRDYLIIPDELIQDRDRLRGWIKRCYDHAKTLRPKPTKKK